MDGRLSTPLNPQHTIVEIYEITLRNTPVQTIFIMFSSIVHNTRQELLIYRMAQKILSELPRDRRENMQSALFQIEDAMLFKKKKEKDQFSLLFNASPGTSRREVDC